MANFASLQGQFLIAMPGIGDARFEKAVILLCAHTEEGAMGFVINQALPEPDAAEFFDRLGIVTELERSNMPAHLRGMPLAVGGPVEPGRGFVLHSSDYSSDTTVEVCEGVAMTATLEILRAIATGRGPERFTIALGYSGWSADQLEREITSNGWLVCPADGDLVFDTGRESIYSRVMQSMGINPHLISGDSGHA